MREDLIELLKDTHANAAWHHWGYEESADHLIANGVTIATDNNVGDKLTPTEPKWIPVAERLPVEHGEYLALTPCIIANRKYSTWLILYDPKRGFYDIDPEWGDIEIDTVTHWMPLPTPPKEG